MLKGTTSSTGVAYGPILILQDREKSDSDVDTNVFSPEKQLERFEKAVEDGKEDLKRLREEVLKKIGEKEEKIFESQTMILEDPALIDEVKNRILNQRFTAENALKQVLRDLEQQFLSIEDRTIRQRIVDIKDVGNRILRELAREKTFALENISQPVILLAHEILPSQAALIDKERILAIITEKGGINSHASIIARSLDIPAVVGVKNLLASARFKNNVFVDGYNGEIYFDPDENILKNYQEQKIKLESVKTPEKISPPHGAVYTGDGVMIQIFANIGKLSELNKLKLYGVEGVGLLRTEFLLMNRQSPPTLDEYVSQFKTILDFVNPLPVNIRLFDLGADKSFPFLSHPKESNPSLGNRGIRYLLGNPFLLKEQIRAILESGCAGNPRILIPMVTTINEIRTVTSFIRRMEMELTEQGKNIKTQIPIGIMIETPACAMMVDKLIKEADFFSIGTNDLIQYILAADRDNEQVQDIYNTLHPAVLKIIKDTVTSANRKKTEISLCGEMSADVRAIPLLLGMGVRKLSVGVNRIPEVKEFIANLSLKKCESLSKKALKAQDSAEIDKIMDRFLQKIQGETPRV